MARLPELLAATLAVRTGATVRELRRTESGWALTVGATNAAEEVTADAVVLAVPAAPAARLLSAVAPAAAAELAEVEYASMAVVTLAFRESAVPELATTDSSGFLVPPVDGRRIKAATFSFSKWGWVRATGGGLLLLRTSLGRYGEEATLQATDEELVAWSLADLRAAVGLSADPVDTHVQRWGGGLPQYAVGHLDRVARIRSAVAGVRGLVVCGAVYDGVGIPAVIASAHRAAREI
jgi:oxygen-dependent protoporphyrinogen oxidase